MSLAVDLPYRVRTHQRTVEMIEWCVDRFGYTEDSGWRSAWVNNVSYDYNTGRSTFEWAFRDSKDHLLFMLRWGG